MDRLEEFREIVRLAVDAERSDPYGWDLVRHGADLVEVCRAHPDAQPDFERNFISMVDSTRPDGAFVEFCMHALRWENVRVAIEHRHRAAIDRNDWRAEPYFRHLLESFDDSWDDANDLYADYFSSDRTLPGSP